MADDVQYQVRVTVKGGPELQAFIKDAERLGHQVEQVGAKANRSFSGMEGGLKGIRSSFGKTAVGFFAFDALAKSADEASRRFTQAGSAARDLTQGLVGMADAARRFDVAGLAANFGQAIGSYAAMGPDFERISAGLNDATMEMERQKNAANILARQGYDTLGKSIQELDATMAQIASTRQDFLGKIFGDPGALRMKVNVLSEMLRGGAGVVGGSLTKVAEQEVRALLDAYSDLGLQVPPKLQAIANSFRVLSTEQGKALDNAKRSMGDSLNVLVDALRKGQEASERAAADRKALVGEYESLSASLDPVYAKELQLRKAEELLDKARKAGLISLSRQTELMAALGKSLQPVLRGYGQLLDLRTGLAAEGSFSEEAQALKDSVKQYENFVRLVRSSGKPLKDQERLIEQMAESLGLAAKNAGQVSMETEAWVEGAHAFADALGVIDSGLGELAHGVTDVVAGFKQINAEGATFKEKQAGWSSVAGGASAIYGAGQTMGWWDAEGGISQFGAAKDKNYAKEGEAIGTIVGAVIGSFIPVVGTAVGAVLGGVLGGIIGSAIKSGADEGLAKLEMVGGQVSTRITKDEGGLGGVIGGVGDRIIDGLAQAMAALNAEFAAIPEVSLKVRNEHVSATVGGVYAWFKTIDEAVSFVMTEILKQAEIVGNISENVKNAIKNTSGGSAEELMANIEFAMKLDRVGMDAVETAILDFMTEYRTAVTKATQLGLDTSKVGEMFGSNLQGLRDQILGVQEDPAKRIQRESALFNAQISLLKAEQTIKLADLKFKREVLMADIGLSRAQNAIDRAHVDNRVRMVEAEAGIVKAERGIVHALFQELAAVDQAIKATEALLANLPSLISDAEIASAIGRSRGGRGRGRGGAGAQADSGIFWDLLHGSGRNAGQSTLNDFDRLAAAETRYQQTLFRAAGGNRQAKGELDAIAKTYLEIAQQFYGNTQQYDVVYRGVMEKLAKFGAVSNQESQARQRAINELFGLADAAAAVTNAMGGGSGKGKKKKGGGNQYAGSSSGMTARAANSNSVYTASFAGIFGGDGGQGSRAATYDGGIGGGGLLREMKDGTDRQIDEARAQGRELRRELRRLDPTNRTQPGPPPPPTPTPGGGVGTYGTRDSRERRMLRAG